MQHYLSAFRHYADYRGRARRAEYWMFLVFHLLVLAALITLGATVFEEIFSLALVYYLATVIPLTALIARRLHDVGYTGWLQLVSLLPFCFIVVLIFMALPGTPGPNQYGPPA
ncbi:DUF805 domain-containing protein [Actinoplanes friuliensis]|uniref:Inner membrane protein yhaI n=1 Tax=Actinoplanes friuliensis DSM 7358 TaxID=1246995 RepID=U5W4F6_9ACTN|nr:DUF805 domain-containing protein [Actinoplanes friuliensis]AGZ43897.1 hypothetical protein AFR_28180 [Actinoplanes friuliensis DSM 7358]